MASELAKQIVHAALSEDVVTVRDLVNEEMTSRAKTIIENAKPEWAASLLETDDQDPEDEEDLAEDEDFEDDEDGEEYDDEDEDFEDYEDEDDDEEEDRD